MLALEKFRQVVEERHGYAREWKARNGGQALGYLCTYVPEEVIYAAGILPLRILGSHEPQDITEPYIFGMYCSFCRDCLAQGLQGRYDYLDGILHAQSCLHIRQTFDSWCRHVPQEYSRYIFMPSHVQSAHAWACLVRELADLQRSLEEWTGRPIYPPALDGAIQVYNTNRRLMKQVYELRKSPTPPLAGAQAMEMVLAGQVMDKQEHNTWLLQALEELAGRKGTPAGIRLMLIGSENHDPRLLRFIESKEATIVIDDLCTGSRYFWNEVIPENDRLGAIARRYLHRPPCPTKDLVKRRRFPHLLGLARDYAAQGAILIQQKFCDPHEFDAPLIQSRFQEQGIPTLVLEVDVTIPIGQLGTRLEAFLEMLETN